MKSKAEDKTRTKVPTPSRSVGSARRHRFSRATWNETLSRLRRFYHRSERVLKFP